MIEETYAVQTADGAMETFLVWPERERPTPAVFLLMDAPGVREELKDMARRLATSGYFVALPNLYYRAGNNPTFGPTALDENSPEWKRMRAIRTKMTIPPVMNDLNTLFDFAKDREEVSDGPMGCHGYCMSGPYALAAAARFPDQIGAAASFYGTWLVNDAEESPHGTFSKTNAEVYIACAEHDELAPLPMVDELRALFKQSQAPGEIEMYPNVHHGFAFPERWCYDKAAAERHWERLLNLYKRKL